MSPKILIAVVGPTAIGKTAMAIELAKFFNCEILSCDSRQFFKEMSIGTAIPEINELTEVTHHFIHNKSIFEEYTVGDFEKEAIAKLDELFINNDFAIVVGGSGLYLDAIIKGFDEFPEVDPAVRANLTSRFKADGISYLHTKLAELDPDYYATVDLENPQRLMRAVEICIGSGKPYSSFLNQKKNTRNFTPIIIGLEAERQEMYGRINLRVDIMIENGLVAEAKKLHSFKNLNALQTVGYRELFSYFEDEITLSFAIEEIKKNTRRFAKRQMTWFKKKQNVMWFDYNNDLESILNSIKSKIQQKL